MARFPYHESNVRELGRLLAEASLDAGKRQALKDDPKKVLAQAGLPASTLALFDFKVILEDTDRKSVVIPYRFNSRKIADKDTDYLTGIADLVSPAPPAALN